MNKIKFSILTGIIFLLSILQSCSFDHFGCIRGEGPLVTQTHNASGFSAIRLETDAIVNIYADSVYSIEINGQKNIIENLSISVSQNVLDIRNKHCTRHHLPLTITIHAPLLNDVNICGSGSVFEYPDNKTLSDASFSITGSGDLHVIGTFHTSNVTARITGSGKADIPIDAEHAETRISGSGKIKWSGSATSQDLHISGSGRVEGYDLNSDDVTAHITGSGKVYVTCNKTLDAEITGSGKLYYHGNPAVTANISGSGKVIHEN